MCTGQSAIIVYHGLVSSRFRPTLCWATQSNQSKLAERVGVLLDAAAVRYRGM